MKALILIDIQNDFLPSGALPVREGDAVIPVANRLCRSGKFDLAVATQDWHPADHRSFAANHPGRKRGDVIELDGLEQILWPVHCVQGTAGAAFASELDMSCVENVVHKGTDPRIDSYSGFFDNGHRKATGLGDYLRERGVDEVVLLGLATDICVKFSALDALKLGFATTVVEDGCRGVNLQPGDDQRALDEMRASGATMAQSDQLLVD